jgi:homoserine O-acetyltransferase
MSEFISTGTRFAPLPSPFAFKRGGSLNGGRMAYETWGQLNPARDNAVLILTGLSPSAHVASSSENPEKGWWESMVGPGKAIDTMFWHVICINTLGSCKGSTGPASMDPVTGEAYRLQFPDLSIEDCASAAKAVLNHLGIESLACLVGNSMGGMVALSFLQQLPLFTHSHINISGSAQALPFSIAIRSLQREAIRLDPHWNLGRYDTAEYPRNGMRIARKLGVVTYRSAMEWDGRFGRVRLNSDTPQERFGMEFEVESYLEAHAERFVDVHVVAMMWSAL